MTQKSIGTDAEAPNDVQKNTSDDKLLRKLVEEVEKNLRNEQFSVEELADNMAMSRSHLHRKIKQATGKSANQFIREYRLDRAIELLRKEDKSIAEIEKIVIKGKSLNGSTIKISSKNGDH